jgi:hypothetical protein
LKAGLTDVPTGEARVRPLPIADGCDAVWVQIMRVRDDAATSPRWGEVVERAARLEIASGSRLPKRGDDVVDDFLDQDAVVALAHHADHGLGAGRADEQAAMAVEALLAVGDG